MKQNPDSILYVKIASNLKMKEKLLNAKDMVNGKKMRSKMQPGLYIFHSPEFNVILLSLSFINEIALVIFSSNLIHIFLDVIEHYKYHKNFFWIKEWSIIHSFKT